MIADDDMVSAWKPSSEAASQDRWLRLSEKRMRRLRLSTIQCGVPRAGFQRMNGFDEHWRRYRSREGLRPSR